jgi:exopolyphosphatase / guanosine-5'-triphosphate,3'-diphosphate pyrophosphatase
VRGPGVQARFPALADCPADAPGTIGEVRVGIVDVGANTLRLLVAVPYGRSVAAVHEEREQRGLGEEVERFGYISAARCADAVAVAREQTRKARKLGCERIEIVVTSPGRQSANGDEFADALARGTGVPVRILSGEQEGSLAWEGAVAAADDPPESVAVCDVGGGSAQIVVGTLIAGPAWARSIDLGSLRLSTRTLQGSDPPSAEAVAVARAAAAEAFDAVVPPVAQLALAAGGTARVLRRVVDRLDGDGIEQAIDELAGLKQAKLAKRLGISPQRARTLLAGTILFAEAQGRLGLPLDLARGGVREGSALALFRESATAYA